MYVLMVVRKITSANDWSRQRNSVYIYLLCSSAVAVEVSSLLVRLLLYLAIGIEEVVERRLGEVVHLLQS